MTIFSTATIASDFPGKEIEGYDNIKVVEKEGEKFLILSEDQYVELANYIEELKAEKQKLEAKLEQAKTEIEKSYNSTSWSIRDTITGAGLASLLIILSQGG